MILIFFMLAVAAFRNDVLGSPAYSSSVYLNRGSASGPALEYVQYGPSASSFGGPQYTRLASAPSSFYPTQYTGVTPCLPPCVYEAAVELAPAPKSAKLVTYNAPISNVVAPTIVEPKPEPYNFAYVVFDENTGDQKAQQELSEAGVVRGQYSLIQPNGYVRHVQYTADDTHGFNAVVKNFLLKSEADTVEIREDKHEVMEDPQLSAEGDKVSKEAVKELGSPEEMTDEKEPESVGESTEITTDVTPEKEESKKYVLTYEDLINCAQAVFEGTEIKKHETHGHGHGGHGHETTEGHPAHQGHEAPEDNEVHSHEEPKSEPAHPAHGTPHGSYGVPLTNTGHVQDEPGHEGHGHPGQPHPPSHATTVTRKTKPKSPLTYIILPSLGGKPC